MEFFFLIQLQVFLILFRNVTNLIPEIKLFCALPQKKSPCKTVRLFLLLKGKSSCQKGAQSQPVPDTIQKMHLLNSEGIKCCSCGCFSWSLCKQSSGKIQCSQKDFYYTIFVERGFLLYQPVSFGADVNTVVTEKSIHTTGFYYVLETADV